MPRRIFILERVTLGELNEGARRPVAGDRVVFLRDAQDLDGTAAAQMRARGVEVTWGPDLLDRDLLQELEAFQSRYLKRWFMEGGVDISRHEDLSLGQFLSGQLSSVQKPPVIVTFGEICRAALRDAADAGTALSDIRDGETVFANQFPGAEVSPRRRIVRDVAQLTGWAYEDLAVSRPLPPIHRSDARTSSGHPLVQMARMLIGGLRPAFLRGRIAARRERDKGPSVYVYFNHGIKLLATALVGRGLRVCGDRAGEPGVTPLRYDHLLALPPTGLRAAARRLRQRLQLLMQGGADSGLKFRGFDYAPFLLPGIAAYLRRRLPMDLIRMAQAIALMRRYRVDLTIINGDTAAMYAAIGYARRHGGRVLHVDHGMNMFRQGLRDGFLNQEHVTYVVHGTDHANAYGSSLSEGHRPRRVLLGNPATSVMNPVIGRRANPPGRRVLMANYTPHYANRSDRLYHYDRYMRDLLTAAGKLVESAVRLSYRPHHGEDPRYIDWMLEAKGLRGRVSLDTSSSFEEALANHDVFVANTTSCIYQALYAGWPTIFYDPQMNPEHFIGMPVAQDIGPPVASSPAELVQKIIAAFDPASEIATFPERFRTVHAERFIGRHASRAHEVIADFIRDELVGTSKQIAA